MIVHLFAKVWFTKNVKPFIWQIILQIFSIFPLYQLRFWYTSGLRFLCTYGWDFYTLIFLLLSLVKYFFYWLYISQSSYFNVINFCGDLISNFESKSVKSVKFNHIIKALFFVFNFANCFSYCDSETIVFVSPNWKDYWENFAGLLKSRENKSSENIFYPQLGK